jgi:hypothetical protein
MMSAGPNPTVEIADLNGITWTNTPGQPFPPSELLAVKDHAAGQPQGYVLEAKIPWVLLVDPAVGITNSSDIFMIGHYAERMARVGVVGIVMTNSPPLVHPFGGTTPVLGTNPIAIAIPRPASRSSWTWRPVPGRRRGLDHAVSNRSECLWP